MKKKIDEIDLTEIIDCIEDANFLGYQKKKNTLTLIFDKVVIEFDIRFLRKHLGKAFIRRSIK